MLSFFSLNLAAFVSLFIIDTSFSNIEFNIDISFSNIEFNIDTSFFSNCDRFLLIVTVFYSNCDFFPDLAIEFYFHTMFYVLPQFFSLPRCICMIILKLILYCE